MRRAPERLALVAISETSGCSIAFPAADFHSRVRPGILVQTAGLEPAHTSRRGALPTELRLHIPGIRRGQEERKDGKNEDTNITPHPHSDTYFYSLAPNWGQRPIFFAIL